MNKLSGILLLVLLSVALVPAQEKKAGEEALGSRKYTDFEKPEACGASCHIDFYQQ